MQASATTHPTHSMHTHPRTHTHPHTHNTRCARTTVSVGWGRVHLDHDLIFKNDPYFQKTDSQLDDAAAREVYGARTHACAHVHTRTDHITCVRTKPKHTRMHACMQVMQQFAQPDSRMYRMTNWRRSRYELSIGASDDASFRPVTLERLSSTDAHRGSSSFQPSGAGPYGSIKEAIKHSALCCQSAPVTLSLQALRHELDRLQSEMKPIAAEFNRLYKERLAQERFVQEERLAQEDFPCTWWRCHEDNLQKTLSHALGPTSPNGLHLTVKCWDLNHSQ